jgi:ATP-dependent RNA helicase DeaD
MMTNSFKELGISPPILKAIEDMGFKEPTEVQSKAIPLILQNKDLIIKSKTGSGKTAVFGITMLQMADPEAPGPQGLILTPTRELAVQVDKDITKLSKYLSHKTTAVYGQHSLNVEIQALKRGVSIVTGTPGRIYDHIEHRNLITKHIRFLVLDEADRMLDMGFIDQVVRIIKSLPKDRLTLLCSATIPDEINRICRYYMENPQTVEIESETMTVDTIKQSYFRVEKNEKRTQLNRLLLYEMPESCMIFCNTKIAVDRVQSYLTRKGYASRAIHGDIPQGKRLRTMEQFKRGDFHILVATDVAARGIHIDGLSLVINYDVPLERDNYVHRIGRTGRVGREGRAISLVTVDDIMSLYEIEEHIGVLIEEEELPTEGELNELKAESEKWKQAMSRVIREPQAASKTGSKNAANKRSKTGTRHKKPYKPRYHDAAGKRTQGIQSSAGTDAAASTGSVNTANQKTPKHQPGPQRKPRKEAPRQAKNAAMQSTRPTQSTPGRQYTADPTGTQPSVSVNSKEIHTGEKDIKKPFLKRLLQRVFGK